MSSEHLIGCVGMRIDRFCFAKIPRQDAGREGDLVFASAPIPHARHFHRHRTNACHHLALGKMTMTDKACPPVLKLFIAKGCHERGQFGLNSLFDQLARAITEDVGERIG